jgi:hypothetical protein
MEYAKVALERAIRCEFRRDAWGIWPLMGRSTRYASGWPESIEHAGFNAIFQPV